MARYINRIPDDYKSGISTIISLSEKDLNTLTQVFEEAPVVLNVREFNQKIVPKIDFLESPKTNNLVDTIGSLYELRSSLNISTEEFVDEIVDVINSVNDESLKLSDENVEEFKKRLNSLLNINSLSIRTKAANLIVDHQIIFRDAKLISDIRPIFGNDVEEKPIATVLVHTLKIEYIENNELKDFHIALDDKDVAKLITLLKRTQIKTESIKEFIKKTDLVNYEVE